MILPESLKLVIETILLRNHQLGDRLPWILLGIPHFADVLDWLVFEVLAQLDLQEIFSVVFLVEIFQPAVKDVRAVCWLDGFVTKFLLRFGARYEAVFADVVAEAIRCLGVLTCGFHVCVFDLVSVFLEVRVGTCFEMFVEFWLIVAVFHSQVYDFSCGFGICKIQGWRGVEFNVVRIHSFAEFFAFHVKDLHSEASRLWDAVLGLSEGICEIWVLAYIETGVSRLAAVSASYWELSTLFEQLGLLQVLG